MKRLVFAASLALLALSSAQDVQLPKPSGPVVEAKATSVEATFRLQGCTRDQQDRVVCSLQVQSTARTNQQVTVLHQSVRAISARGFSYPGYLSAEGGKVEANRSFFALPAGGRVAAKLVFPGVPKEETSFAVVYVGGVEFRGIPIGTAQAQSQPAQAQAAQPAQPQVEEIVITDLKAEQTFEVGEVEVVFQGCSGFFRYATSPYIGCTFKAISKVDGAKLSFNPASPLFILKQDGNAHQVSDEFGYSIARSDGAGNPIPLPLAGTPFQIRIERYVQEEPTAIARLLLDITYISPDGQKGPTKRLVFRNAKF